MTGDGLVKFQLEGDDQPEEHFDQFWRICHKGVNDNKTTSNWIKEWSSDIFLSVLAYESPIHPLNPSDRPHIGPFEHCKSSLNISTPILSYACWSYSLMGSLTCQSTC
jgi:hypothetical protein